MARLFAFISLFCITGCSGSSDSLLHWATQVGTLSGTRIMLMLGADPNSPDELGYTPLHFAVIRQHSGVVDLLVRKGANVNAKNDLDQTPLYQAALINSLNMARLLVEKGAEIDLNGIGESPLCVAALLNNLDVAEFLIQKGAVVNGRGTRTEMSPLSAAASSGHSEAVILLLKSGADINDPLAVGLAASGGHKEVVQMLIEKGCPISKALHHLAFDDRMEIAELLIEKGANVNEKSESGDTPLHRAAFYGAEGVVGVLLANGADVSIEDDDGLKPFELAIDGGHRELAETLRLPKKNRGRKIGDVHEIMT